MKLVAAAFAGLVLLAACGESEISGAQAAFIEVVDARCAEVDRDLAEAGNPAESVESADRWVEVIGAFREDVRAMDAPREEIDVWNRYLANVDNAYHSLQALQRAVASGDEARTGRYSSEAEAAIGQANEVAEKYGLKVCSQA